MKHALWIALWMTFWAGLLGFSGQARAEKPIVVLVPGFFNQLSPGYSRDGQARVYFSKAIEDSIQSRGYRVRVVDTLMPLGSVEENGRELAQSLELYAQEAKQDGLILIAHSAGGIYSLKALTLNPLLPVRAVITLSTPYGGVEFAERIHASIPILERVAELLNLESLREFLGSHTRKIISQLRQPKGLRWVALAGYQPPCRVIDCHRSNKLSWPMSLTQSLMSRASDGVVTVDSSFGHGSGLRLELWDRMLIPLEHWEMVEDARLFSALGVVDFRSIEETQSAYMREVLIRLEQGFSDQARSLPQAL